MTRGQKGVMEWMPRTLGDLVAMRGCPHEFICPPVTLPTMIVYVLTNPAMLGLVKKSGLLMMQKLTAGSVNSTQQECSFPSRPSMPAR